MSVVAGFGGALTALPPPGGVLLAAECWRLEPAGQLPRREDFQPVAPPQALVAHLQAQGLAAYAGTLVTTPKITPKASLPTQVSHLTLPVLDLETSEVAATATAHHLPFLAVRAITDGAGEEIQVFLADIINQYQGVPLSRLLPALWADPRRVGYCLHLWRRSRLAGQNLARALNLILNYLTQARSPHQWLEILSYYSSPALPGEILALLPVSQCIVCPLFPLAPLLACYAFTRYSESTQHSTDTRKPRPKQPPAGK